VKNMNGTELPQHALKVGPPSCTLQLVAVSSALVLLCLTLLFPFAFLFYFLPNPSPIPLHLVLHPSLPPATRRNFSSSGSFRAMIPIPIPCAELSTPKHAFIRGRLPYSNMSPHAAMLSNCIPVRFFAALLVFAFTLVRAAPFSNVTINLRSFTSHIPSEQNCL
jgi:hypothetical protein